jgi:hypothetical protein
MIFHDFSRIFTGSWIYAQKRDTRAILLKIAPVRVSCIQNTQIRGETIAKVFGKVDTFWTYQVPEQSFWFRIAVSDGGGAAELYLGKTPNPRYFQVRGYM